MFWLVARSEAWSVCIGAAGGSVGRRRLYRASSVGYRTRTGDRLDHNSTVRG
ncbi:MAG TPA: hypothetical protein VK920_07840 [Solirubrobacterales bacterium]|nr:hypothetical protein [Solirubrobacterales bacterium]